MPHFRLDREPHFFFLRAFASGLKTKHNSNKHTKSSPNSIAESSMKRKSFIGSSSKIVG